MAKSDGVRRPTKREQASLDKLAQPIPGAEPELNFGKSRPVDDYPDLVDTLPEMAKRSRELAIQEKAIAAERKALNADIQLLLDAVEATSVRGDDWVAVISNGSTAAELSPTLLLAEGVEMEVIERCTVPGKPYKYVQVRKLTARPQPDGGQ